MDGIQAPFGFWDPFGFAAEVSHSSGLALLSVFARRPPFHPSMSATVAVPQRIFFGDAYRAVCIARQEGWSGRRHSLSLVLFIPSSSRVSVKFICVTVCEPRGSRA